MYEGASTDGECPLVVHTTTPSCGNSRFGCWVCTVVDKDRSMEVMIKNDDEKIWMTPLLDLRNDLADFSQEKVRRDFRRIELITRSTAQPAGIDVFSANSNRQWYRGIECIVVAEFVITLEL